MWLVIGGDFAANRADVVGVYSNHQDAVRAAQEAGQKVKDGDWFGCHITYIRVDAPVRNAWNLDLFNGWRRSSKRGAA